MTAHHFILTRLDTGALVGHALLCPEARYASVRWKGADRLDRRFADPAGWKAVEADLQAGWEKGRVDGRSATAKTLVRDDQRGTVALQWSAGVPIAPNHAGGAEGCDAYLLQQAWV